MHATSIVAKFKRNRFPKVAIKQSTLANAGLGLFADEDIAGGIVLPYEYRGDRLTEKECEQLTDTSYVWEITADNGEVICIDAKPHRSNNFIRYVNGAGDPKQCKQVNLTMVQENDRVYYQTTKRVIKGEELIVDYGDEYFEGANGKSFSC